MSSKSRGLILIQRVLLWTLYFFSGFILYSNKGILPSFLITFSRIIYPLSIFWLQIRIKKITNFLPIDSKMSTSQLWFNLLPVVASLLTIIFSLTNSFLFILARMQSFPEEVYDAAKIDGASPLQQFYYISLPFLIGIMSILFLLRFIWTFNKFDDIFLLTGGNAGTRTFTVNVYEQAFAISNLLFGFMISQSIFALIPKDNLSVEVSPSRLLYSLPMAYFGKSLLLR